MIQTPNLGLEKYELTDAANLADGYNNSMDTLDKFASDTNEHFPIQTNDIADNAVTNAKLNNGAITTDKIVDANVTNSKLASDSITADKIVDASVTNSKLASDSITADKIVDASVTNSKLASDSVTADKIPDGEIINRHIGDLQITTDKLANNSISYDKLQNNSINFTKIENYGISNLNISDGITVVFGDSWGTAPVWVKIFRNKVKGDFRNYCISGAQFLGEDNSSSIASQINNFVNDTSINKNFVKTIIIIGGVNDYLFSNSDAAAHGKIFQQTLAKLYSVVKDSIPTFWFANFSWNYNSTINSQLRYHNTVYHWVRTMYPIIYTPLHDKFNVNELDTANWYHLNEQGMFALADIIYSTIFGGKIITRPFLTYKFHVKGNIGTEHGTDQDVIFNQYIEGNKEYKSIEFTRADLFNSTTSNTTSFTLTEIEGNAALSSLSYHINNSTITFNLKVANNFRLCTLYDNVYSVIIDNDIYSYFHIDTSNMQLSIVNKTRNNGAPSKLVNGDYINVSFDYHEYSYVENV